MATTNDKVLWSDRERYFGLPLSFTQYSLSEDRLFISEGFLTIRDDEILLYRVRDLELSRSFGQRIFGVGTIKVCSSDKTHPELYIQNVKDPAAVKELIHEQVEDMKIRRRVRFGEIASFGDDIDDVMDNEI